MQTFLPILLAVAAADNGTLVMMDHSSGGVDDDDDGAAAASFLFVYAASGVVFLVAYTSLAYATWPTMRYRTGFPFLFLALALVFPPVFFVMLFYLLIAAFVWPAVPMQEVIVVERAEPSASKPAATRHLSQAERRELRS